MSVEDGTAGDREEQWRRTRGDVIRDALGIGVATGAYGLSFGAISSAAGFSLLQTVALSLLMFSGASQFAMVSVVGGGGSPWPAGAAAILLGSRNALYGLRLSSLIGRGRATRFAVAHLVIDETTAMAVAAPSERAAPVAFWATGIAVLVLWNLGTVIGALGAQAVPDPRTLGLDAAAPAAFLALLAPRMRGRRPWAVALTASAVAVVAVPLVPAGVPILLAALMTVAMGWPAWERRS